MEEAPPPDRRRRRADGRHGRPAAAPRGEEPRSDPAAGPSCRAEGRAAGPRNVPSPRPCCPAAESSVREFESTPLLSILSHAAESSAEALRGGPPLPPRAAGSVTGSAFAPAMTFTPRPGRRRGEKGLDPGPARGGACPSTASESLRPAKSAAPRIAAVFQRLGIAAPLRAAAGLWSRHSDSRVPGDSESVAEFKVDA